MKDHIPLLLGQCNIDDSNPCIIENHIPATLFIHDNKMGVTSMCTYIPITLKVFRMSVIVISSS